MTQEKNDPSGGLPPILQLEQVSAGYGRGVVLHQLSLQVNAGSSLAILGRNGMGKSTLLATLMGLTRHHGGRIQLDGHDISHLPSWRRARQGLGWAPQERAVFNNLTVQETLDIVARPGYWTCERVYQHFPRLQERKAHAGNELSGGEQQMLAIARALITNPRVLLLDEPLEGLASIVAGELLQTLAKLVSDTGLTTLIVEQKPEQVLPLTTDVIILDRGSIVYQDSTANLLQDPVAQNRWLGLAQ